MEFFDWLEHCAFSTVIKENWMLYETPLLAHAIGMAIMVGLSTAVYLRLLGIASGVPLAPLRSYFKLMWTGFWMNAVSGVVLFALGPMRLVVNPVFYIKIVGVILSVVYLRKVYGQAYGPSAPKDGTVSPEAKTSAATGLAIWLGTITAGRLLAYQGITGVEKETAIATLVVTVALFIGYRSFRSRMSGVAG